MVVAENFGRPTGRQSIMLFAMGLNCVKRYVRHVARFFGLIRQQIPTIRVRTFFLPSYFWIWFKFAEAADGGYIVCVLSLHRAGNVTIQSLFVTTTLFIYALPLLVKLRGSLGWHSRLGRKLVSTAARPIFYEPLVCK